MPIHSGDDREKIEDYVPRYQAGTIPDTGIFDKPCRCVGINEDWIPYVDGALHLLTYPAMWEGTEEEIQVAIDQILELQISMANCGCGGSRVDGLGINELIRQDLQARFDAGGLDGVAPDRPDTFFNADSGDTGGEIDQRTVALCWAAHDYVVTLAEEGFDILIDVDLAVAAAGFGLSVLFTPIVGVAFTAASRLLIELAEEALRSKACVDAVGCCMFTNLSGLAVNQANFSVALDSCAGLDAECVPLANLIQTTLADEKNWLAFVSKMGSFFEAATQDLADCSCGLDTWEHTFDFTVSDGGWIDDPARPDFNAFYTPGVGWQVNHVNPGASFGIALAMTKDATFTDFCLVRTGPSVVNRVMVVEPMGSPDVDCISVSQPVDTCQNTPFVCTLLFASQGLKCVSTSLTNGLGTWSSLTLKGTGINPFI